jgi:hypothetical protein
VVNFAPVTSKKPMANSFQINQNLQHIQRYIINVAENLPLNKHSRRMRRYWFAGAWQLVVQRVVQALVRAPQYIPKGLGSSPDRVKIFHSYMSSRPDLGSTQRT